MGVIGCVYGCTSWRSVGRSDFRDARFLQVGTYNGAAFVSGSDDGRGFGSAFHHHIQGLEQSPGPFSSLKSPRHAGFRPPVLRVVTSQNARNRPLSRPEPSLFSVWPAGRRRWGSRKINNLRVPDQRQPRPPVRHRTPPEDRQRLLDRISIEIHNCGNGGFDHGSFHDAARPGGRRNQDASQ